MRYEDGAGQRLLSEQPGQEIISSGQYFGLIFGHPVTMAALLARHLINGFDQRYSTPYVERLDNGSHRWLRAASFTLIFLALLRLLWPTARRSLGTARWRYLVALLLGCLTAVPSAMESRYLLPAYLLSYMLVLAPGWPNPLDSKRAATRRLRTVVTIGLAYAAFTVIVWHVASGASASLRLSF